MSSGSSIASPSGAFWSGSAGPGSVRSTTSRNGDLPPHVSDPPREAREGREWVWFPEGYWAERPLERQNSTREANGSQASTGSQGSQSSQMQSAVNKVFRWGPRGSRSPKEPSAVLIERPESVSPMTTTVPSPSQRVLSQFAPPKNLPSSPYMSEREQTLALQHPGKKGGASPGSRDTWTRLNSTTTPIAELILPDSRPSTQPISSKSSWGAFRKAKEACHFHVPLPRNQ